MSTTTKPRQPTSAFQPRTFEARNLYTFEKVSILSPADLLKQHHEFGARVFFSHPLQRRVEYQRDRAQFWYEPSGGRNAHLFEGIVVGVRTLSTGYKPLDEGGYTPEATYAAYLVAFSPYRKPVLVLPWHTWINADEYNWHRKQAIASYEARRARPA